MNKPLTAALASLCFGIFCATTAGAAGGVAPPPSICPIGTTCGREPPPTVSFPSDPDKEPFLPSDCRNLGKHYIVVTKDGGICVPVGPCPLVPNPFVGDPDCLPVPINFPFVVDPNDKEGVRGAGSARFIPGTTPLGYNILFENLPTATARVQQVVVSDQLDPRTMDLSTLSLGPIRFGEISVMPSPGLSGYNAAVDLRPGLNIVVHIDATLDKGTGLLKWQLTAVDPDTLQLPEDPLVGFLPPNTDPPAGQGGVTFTVMPKSGLVTGTVINNQASIVFDTNAAITTPLWLNTIDSTPPVTHVAALPATQPTASFPVQWVGSDAGSGIALFSVFVSDNGGPFTVWQDETTATSATYAGQAGHNYGFYSIGVDLVGNVEASKTTAEATTSIGTTTACASNVSSQVQVTRSGYGYNFTTARFVQTVTLKNTGTGIITGPISLVLDSLSSNATLFNLSGATACAVPAGSPYINTAGDLNPGASVSVSLQFTNPTKAGITYATRVLSGSAPR